jgi:hypothetical protein
MNRQQVDDYVTRCQQIVQRAPEMNEETTKVRLVQPFLELLGWDCHSTAVELEYTVPMASGKTRVDYALVVGDAPAVFVEAKAARSELTDEDLRQLKSYMRQELVVEWGILTNGKTFEVLTKRSGQRGGGEVSVVQFDLAELREQPDVLELLSKDSIRSGQQRVSAKSTATGETVRDLIANETRISATIAKTIEEEIGRVELDLEAQAHDFIRQLASKLREQDESTSASRSEPGLDRWLTETTTDRDRSRTIRSTRAAGDTATSPHSDDRGYVTRLSDGTEIPDRDGERHHTQRQNMTAVVDHLLAEHNLASAIDLPYAPAGEHGRCTINVVPRHPDGTHMKDPYTLRDGTYLRTLLGTDEKQTRLKDLAAQVGHSVEFHGEWRVSSQRVLEQIARS